MLLHKLALMIPMIILIGLIKVRGGIITGDNTGVPEGNSTIKI
jgi:hypothetical protein